MAVNEKVVSVRQKPRISVEEYRKKLGLKRLNEFGQELPDNVPMDPPVGYKKQPSIFENMREMVKAELARKAVDEGFDTEDDKSAAKAAMEASKRALKEPGQGAAKPPREALDGAPGPAKEE